jgi:phosphoacetylglucosamine mutase
MNARPVHFGLVTTPQLHWLIAECNAGGLSTHATYKAEDYVNTFAKHFNEFNELLGDKENKRYEKNILLDCANGVGSVHIKPILVQINENLQVEIINDDLKPDLLNEDCGAEFVQKE